MFERIIRSVSGFVRGLRLTWHIVKGALITAIHFRHADPNERDVMIQQWSRACLAILNVRLRIHGDVPSSAPAILFAANHVSWLDILGLNAVKRVRFVAKSEVRRWPLVGWLAKQADTLFIKRNSPSELIPINRSLHIALKGGQSVGLFPEGTTSSGRSVLRFHSGLFESAVTSRSAVCPVALSYQTSDGHPCFRAAFVGNQTLLASIWNVLTLPVLYLNLHFMPPLSSSQFDRHELSQHARTAILAKVSHTECPWSVAHAAGSQVECAHR
ncbi:1-acyl-sn-glycerol-3-phosphate acyltransferase [Nitrospira sp. KM1]|uniref:lysophospholipid acyltransferase family protein n=1 Tax=Nitrospira sp. KM1 TaxID=1936990 RepID=UPI0013A737B8|nr:lysophospholipid acyltransferase family protein [Nitrospira sp. KM1]BCA54898.1 1-acyl-sn-glycerol-3-phosphate acyltransferase [Nitrospira sp. KM1]